MPSPLDAATGYVAQFQDRIDPSVIERMKPIVEALPPKKKKAVHKAN
jgi:hypothetical protein